MEADTVRVGTHESSLVQAGGFIEGDLLRRAWPFLSLIIVGFVAIPLPPSGGRAGPIIAAAIALAAAIVAAAWAPWHRIPGYFQVLPMLGFLAVVALLRDSEGGAVSGVGPTAMVPVFWCALYGSRSQLATVLVAVACVFAVPAAVIGPPHYPVTEWERAILWTASGLVFGLTVQGLVGRLRLQSRQLSELAHTDGLTELPNRRMWDEALVRETARARRFEVPLCIALLDVDHLKRLNDVHGHPAADRFLKKLATRWSAQLRGIDVLARIGGDEFGLLLPGLSLSEAESVVARLQKLVPNHQSVSAGLAATDGNDRPDDVIVRADRALREAKHARVSRRASEMPVPAR